MEVFCSTSCIRWVSLRRYSLTVSGERSTTWATSPSMVVRRPPMSSASFAPSTARMALKASNASSTTAQRSSLTVSRSSSALVTVSTSGNRASCSGVTRSSVPQTAARALRASAYWAARAVFTLTWTVSAAVASTVMKTSTFPRETAFCTRPFTAASAKAYIRDIFTVQSRYRLLTLRTSTVMSRRFRVARARP